MSSGGIHPKQKIKGGPGYQSVSNFIDGRFCPAHDQRAPKPFAKAVKDAVGDKMAVGTVGSITSGKQANQLLEEGSDLAIVGRMFQKNPGLVWTFAEDLGVQINVANQIRWVRPSIPTAV